MYFLLLDAFDHTEHIHIHIIFNLEKGLFNKL